MTSWIILIIIAMTLIWIGASFSQIKKSFFTSKPMNDRTLYQHNLMQLQQALDKNDITTEEFNELAFDLKKQLLLDQKITEQTIAPPSNDVQKNHLGSYVIILLTSLLFFISSWFLYQRWGNPAGVVAYQENQALENKAKTAISKIVLNLQETLKNNPSDSQSWYLLARAFMSLSEYDQAIMAYKRVIPLVEPSSDLFSEIAQALYIANQQSTNKEIDEMLQQSLSLDENHIPTLRMLAQIEYDQHHYQKAVVYLEKVYHLLAEGEEKNQLKAQIDELKLK